MQALRTMYGNNSRAAAGRKVPEPVEAYVTRWAADPYARGAYSYYAVGNPKNITGALPVRHIWHL
jgi:hypothetical protein